MPLFFRDGSFVWPTRPIKGSFVNQQEHNNNSYKKVGCHSFSERGKVGSPSHKRRVCVVQQKESGYVCKILPNKQIALSGL